MTELESHKSSYAGKASDYYEQERRELLPFIPAGVRRVLDVGCGVGAFGALLKERLGAEVWGVEPGLSAHEQARKRLDHTFHGEFGAALPQLAHERFDLITFNDVLEHMLSPELGLRQALTLLAPGGFVLASIPNFRYFLNLWEVVIRGEWEYKKSGILDATHLRFFTRKSMIRLFQRVGYEVRDVQGIAPFHHWRVSFLKAVTLGALDDIEYQAFMVLATSSAQVANEP